MDKKRNHFRTAMAVLALVALAEISPPAQAQITEISAPKELSHTIDALLKNIRIRDRDAAFALLSTTAQHKFGDDARTFMNTVRLHHHALYDHTGYHLIDQPAQLAATHKTSSDAVIRVQLMDHRGHETLLLIRLNQDPSGAWTVDGLTALGNEAGRDA